MTKHSEQSLLGREGGLANKDGPIAVITDMGAGSPKVVPMAYYKGRYLTVLTF